MSRQTAAILFVLLLPVFPGSQRAESAVQEDAPVQVTAELTSEEPLTRGSTVNIDIVADITRTPDSKGKHWHIYPRAEQHQGVEVATRIKVSSKSNSLTFADVQWPTPGLITNAFGEFQPAYEGRTVFKLPVSISTDAPAGDHEVTIEFAYQTCASLCLPPTTETLNLVLSIPPATTADESPESAAMPTEKIEGPVTASLIASPPTVRAGNEATLELTVRLDPLPDAEGKSWHFYPRAEQHEGVEVPTSIEAKVADPLTTDAVVWPEPGLIINAEGLPQAAYEGDNTFQIPVRVPQETKAGEYPVTVSFTYQACASQCLFPTTIELTTRLIVSGSEASTSTTTDGTPETPGPATSDSNADNADTGAEDDSGDGTASTESDSADNAASRDSSADFQTSVFGAEFSFAADSVFAIPLLLLFAFVGGFLLNLTPCVLPIIPIKIMGLTQSAAGNPRRAKVLGISMGLGILAFWLAIGAAISFISGFDSISSLFQRPVFGISVGLFIAFMGLGMLVDITIQLPQAVHRFNPKHETLHGAFLFGVMTAVLSTPCTAPFMGSAAAWATKADNASLVLAVFAAIAAGMGWPYVLLSWYPNLVSKVPRTGPGSVLVKQVMGLLMLAVAAFFGGTGVLGLVKQYPHLGPVLHWWIATLFVGMMCVWLTLQTFRITKSMARRIGFSLLSAALFAGMAIWSNGETSDSWEAHELYVEQQENMESYIARLEDALENGDSQTTQLLRPPPWRPYSPDALARVKDNGSIAIVHFTADW